MSIFDNMLAAADDIVDDVFAEPFTWHPQTRSANGRAKGDPVRPSITGVGIYTVATSDTSGIQTGNRSFSTRRNDLRLQVAGRGAVLSVASSQFGDTDPKQGDVVELPKRGRFQITSVRDDGHNRYQLHLVMC